MSKHTLSLNWESPPLPHILKYMGSKREILPFVLEAIRQSNVQSENFCDLFAGTCIVGASLKDKYHIHLNDIQEYSSIFAQCYLSNQRKNAPEGIIQNIKRKAKKYVCELANHHPVENTYSQITSFAELQKIEEEQRRLIEQEFHTGFHLFTKYYSGTYWSHEQCVWIDSIRAVSMDYAEEVVYPAILSALIYAMSYTSQGTGHFAQYRDVSIDNMQDILNYRTKHVWPLFEKKLDELITTIDHEPLYQPHITTLGYLDCLKIVEPKSIIYADPPYSAVHYSRFYHAIETLVKYDYPEVRYKARYRCDRHQSPFCTKKKVFEAFEDLFVNTENRLSHLFLSYSDNGMISIDELFKLARSVFGSKYKQELLNIDHIHSKMGSATSFGIPVKEHILLFTSS